MELHVSGIAGVFHETDKPFAFQWVREAEYGEMPAPQRGVYQLVFEQYGLFHHADDGITMFRKAHSTLARDGTMVLTPVNSGQTAFHHLDPAKVMQQHVGEGDICRALNEHLLVTRPESPLHETLKSRDWERRMRSMVMRSA